MRGQGNLGGTARTLAVRAVAAIGCTAAVVAVGAGCTTAAKVGKLYVDQAVAGSAELLVPFDSCDQALRGLRSAARAVVGPYGLLTSAGQTLPAKGGVPQGVAAQPGVPEGAGAADAAGAAARANALPTEPPEHSGTNTQELGVDEPDTVKTDGRRIVTVVGGSLRVVSAADRRVVATVALPEQFGRGYGRTQLLMAGDRVLVLAGTSSAVGLPAVATDSAAAPEPVLPSGPRGPSASIALIDLAGTPSVLSTTTIDGSYVDARAVGPIVRVVVRSAPDLRFPSTNGSSTNGSSTNGSSTNGGAAKPGGGRHTDAPGTDDERVAANQKIVDRAPIEAWLPKYQVTAGGRTTEGRLSCTALSRPASYTGASVLTVHTIDMAGPQPGSVAPVGVVADGETVYASGNNLYVANDRRTFAAWATTRSGVPAASQRTQLFAFDIAGNAAPKYLAAGEVPGYLLSQYSLSEYEGHLRVVTTSDPGSGVPGGGVLRSAPSSSTSVAVLRRDGDRLATVGSVGGLGRGERVYAVRFIGPTGYVVTFRQMDPLYTIDLRDPTKPQVAGELKITGYSAYLHPFSAGKLIGVGQEASTSGMRQGTQVSLFDVSDPRQPTRTAQYVMAGGTSAVESDPHAFLYWSPTRTLVIPVTGTQPVPGEPPQPGGTRADGAKVGKPPASPMVPPQPDSARDGDAISTSGNANTGSATSSGAARSAIMPTTGALVLTVGGETVTEVGTLRQPARSGSVSRSLVIGQTLWTVSNAGMAAYDLTTLAESGWVALE